VSGRELKLGELHVLYAALGWALPTSIEYASGPLLEVTLAMARDTADKRGAR
jgi:hypothetical protein